MTYSVKEIYYTLQGEGYHAGRPAVFCRFSGCNLWSGLEQDRSGAVCKFCDTNFVGTDGPNGGKFSSPEALVNQVLKFWPRETETNPFLVCTGGEPLLQLDQNLLAVLHTKSVETAVETNGTLSVPEGIDWVCVSPKAGAQLQQTTGDELKLVFPQEGLDPEEFTKLNFRYFYLQPLDNPRREYNTSLAVEYCKAHPHWRLSLQTHKFSGIP
ncbi:MAG: 7-carboxy-7-deazaguanine synthase [Fidelibacterota bacterium]